LFLAVPTVVVKPAFLSNHIGRTSLLRLLIYNAPCPHKVSNMAALILNFRVVTHIVRLFGNEAGEDGKRWSSH